MRTKENLKNLSLEERIEKVKLANAGKEVAVNLQQEELNERQIYKFINNLSTTQLAQAKKQLGLRKAREDYFEYWKMCYPDYVPTKFHKFLCQVCQSAIERIERGEKVRILLSIPPRHGKTETVTKTLPSWFVMRNPTKNAILTAYNAELAEKFNNANRDKVRAYGVSVFGNVEISQAQDNKAYFQTTKGGGCMGVGVMGGITGNGGELIIVDDPYKNSVEANSPQIRQTLYNVFQDSIFTRLQGKGNALIIIQTRWHEEDLCGILAKTNDYFVINIPCMCEDEKHDPMHRRNGETLCPEIGFDAKWLEQTKKAVGLKVFNALYQGKPSIDGGEVFLRENIHYYTKATQPPSYEEMVMSCDLSFGGIKQQNDPCAIQIWGRVGANHYLVKRVKKRMTFNEMCEMIKVLSAKYPLARRKIVEKKANGQAVIDSLNNIIGGFEAFDPKMVDKLGRANAITPLFDAGNIFFPSEEIDPTIEEMVDEMLKFPNSEHDDEVDAMTQYLNSYEYKHSGRVLTDSYFSNISNALRGIKI